MREAGGCSERPILHDGIVDRLTQPLNDHSVRLDYPSTVPWGFTTESNFGATRRSAGGDSVHALLLVSCSWPGPER